MKLKELLSVIDDTEWITVIFQHKTIYEGILLNMALKYCVFNFKVINLCVMEDKLVITIEEEPR